MLRALVARRLPRQGRRLALAGYGMCLALAVWAGSATSARASVSVAPDRVTVDLPGARVLVQRAPVRVSFADPAGHVVLEQVTASAAPSAGAGINVTGGTNPGQLPAPYEPFVFEEGGAASTEWAGPLWYGNLVAADSAGAIEHAISVTAARVDGQGGARLTLATTDPLRTIDLSIDPDGSGAVRVRAALSNASGVSAMGDAFTSEAGEAFHGFGGRHNSLDQHGNAFYNWDEEENLPAGVFQPLANLLPGSGNEKYLFPNGATASYYTQNQFISSRGYGFLLNETPLTRWRLDSDSPTAWQFSVASAQLDYTVAIGDGDQAIAELTAITGRHRVPAPWPSGALIQRGVRIINNGDTPATYQAKIEDDLKQIQALHPAIDAYSYEGWHGLPQDFVVQTNQRLQAMGIHPVGYLRAFVSNDGIFDDQQLYDEAVNNHYVATTPGGQPYVFDLAASPAVLIDFTNPAAVRWWQTRVDGMLDLGFDGFMQDFGEQVQSSMHFYDGEDGYSMHNRYPLIYHAVTREIVDRYVAAHPGRQIFFYTRSGFSGRPGSAASENANFPGDETADWSRSNGLPAMAPDMLNRSVGGLYGYSTDVGGYSDDQTQDGQPLSKELFIRWMEWAALTPIFRLHNSCCTLGTRMPWSFDAETLRMWNAMAALHRAASGYIRSLWAEADRTGKPFVRPLWLAFPSQPQLAGEDQEWMVGDDVLVAPVVQKDATSRTVAFPPGCWQHGETGARYRGPATITVAAPLDSLPYFTRCGAQPFTAPLPVSSVPLCNTRLPFSFRVHQNNGRVIRVRVFIDGHRVEAVHRHRITHVTITPPARSQFTVRIVAFTVPHKRVVSVRRYRPCAKGAPRTRVHRHDHSRRSRG